MTVPIAVARLQSRMFGLFFPFVCCSLMLIFAFYYLFCNFSFDFLTELVQESLIQRKLLKIQKYMYL